MNISQHGLGGWWGWAVCLDNVGQVFAQPWPLPGTLAATTSCCVFRGWLTPKARGEAPSRPPATPDGPGAGQSSNGLFSPYPNGLLLTGPPVQPLELQGITM